MFWLIGDTVDRARAQGSGTLITIGRSDLPAEVADLASRDINYDEREAPPHVTEGWHRDRVTIELGHEAPGEPEKGGLAETAGELVNSYEFSDPRILRAAYKYPGDLVGRNMLLEGRFLFLRFLLGVRIVAAHDELVDGPNGPERLIGWSYATLDGHLEQGKLRYEIAKEIDTGRVEFRIIAYSRWSPIRNQLVWAGFNLFGRRTQLSWYHHAMTRLERLLNDPPETPEPDADGIVRAPVGCGPGPVRGVRDPVRAPRRGHAAPQERREAGLNRIARATPRAMRPFDDIVRIERAQVLDKPVGRGTRGRHEGPAQPDGQGRAARRLARSSPASRCRPVHGGLAAVGDRCWTRSADRWAAVGGRRRSSSPRAWRRRP